MGRLIVFASLQERFSNATVDLHAHLEQHFGANNANKLMFAFIDRLATATVDAPDSAYRGKLVDDQAYRACIRAHGTAKCVQSLAIAVRGVLDGIVEKECPDLVSGEYESACTTLPTRPRSEAAQQVAKVLIPSN